MPSIDILIAFATATAIFAYMPGPAMLYTAAQTIARGRSAGFFAAFGIHIGCYVHVVAAALGLSAIFELVPALFTVVTYYPTLFDLSIAGFRIFTITSGS